MPRGSDTTESYGAPGLMRPRRSTGTVVVVVALLSAGAGAAVGLWIAVGSGSADAEGVRGRGPVAVASAGTSEPPAASGKGEASPQQATSGQPLVHPTNSPGEPAPAEDKAAPEDDTVKERVILAGPSLESWPITPARRRPRVRRNQLAAVAYYYRTEIFRSTGRKAREQGYARRGTQLPATRRVRASGCKGGQWYKLSGGGYACTSRGFRVEKNPGEMTLHYALPDQTRWLPYDYAKVTVPKAPLLYRVPTAEEAKQIQAAMAGKGKFPDVVDKQMDGIFLLALHEPVEASDGRRYVRTVYGRYVREEYLKPKPLSEMHGERLGHKRRHRLPLAFVFGEDRPVHRLRRGRLERVGVAEKHARFSVTRGFERGGVRYVADRKGRVLRRDHVRVASKIKRPAEVGRHDKWIHVDLSQQTLVAYKGATPVFATVISGGKEGHAAPTGTYRIQHKHVTTTMNGPDPIDKWYDVEEVPWTMYYHESFALHGAYWHDDFGKVRSHGCTNLAPADARWLFFWTSPSVPAGWHGVTDYGTWVNFTA